MGQRPIRILIVEDNKADVFLIRAAIEAKIKADFQVVHDGEKAVLLIDAADRDESVPCPDIVILDINLPKKPGAEVLSHMRKSRRCAGTPVLAVTSSDSRRDREEMQKNGADAYFRKPSDYTEFMRLGDIIEVLLSNPTG